MIFDIISYTIFFDIIRKYGRAFIFLYTFLCFFATLSQTVSFENPEMFGRMAVENQYVERLIANNKELGIFGGNLELLLIAVNCN